VVRSISDPTPHYSALPSRKDGASEQTIICRTAFRCPNGRGPLILEAASNGERWDDPETGAGARAKAGVATPFADADPLAATVHRSARVTIVTRPSLVDEHDLAVRCQWVTNSDSAGSVKGVTIGGVGNAAAVNAGRYLDAGEDRRRGVGWTVLGVVDEDPVTRVVD